MGATATAKPGPEPAEGRAAELAELGLAFRQVFRTLNRLRGLKTVAAIGIAYAAQEVAEVPVTPRDAQLDLVLTEHEAIDCRGS